MSDEIIKVLDQLCEKFGIAIDWTSKNVLPYLQELCSKCVSYELWTSVLGIILELIVISGFVLLVYKSLKKNKNGDTLYRIAYLKDLEVLFIITLVLYAIFTIFIIFALYDDLSQIITCLVFPEKVILEFIQTIK